MNQVFLTPMDIFCIPIIRTTSKVHFSVAEMFIFARAPPQKWSLVRNI